MQHMVLHNHPTLSIAMERLACLNNSRDMVCRWGPSPSTYCLCPGPHRWCTTCLFVFLHPPFLIPLGDSFFCTFPTTPVKVLRLLQKTTMKSNKRKTFLICPYNNGYKTQAKFPKLQINQELCVWSCKLTNTNVIRAHLIARWACTSIAAYSVDASIRAYGRVHFTLIDI